jgi:hypothetical protein
MRTLLITIIVTVMLLPLTTSIARADVSVGLSADENGINEFHLAIGDFYRVPEKEVIVVRERNIPEDELPVVFFIAQRARVRPETIVDMRLKGDSWMDITQHFGLGPDIFYIPVKEVSGPPYGKAYGNYNNRPRKEWKQIRLDDDDIVNLVNLRFMSKHYGYAPEQVMRYRSNGDDFLKIDADIRQEKSGGNHDQGYQNQKGNGEDNHGNNVEGRGRGRGHNK